jgi:preprotein translocase subunit YajC
MKHPNPHPNEHTNLDVMDRVITWGGLHARIKFRISG